MGGIRKALALIGIAVSAAAAPQPHRYVPSAHHAHRPPGYVYNDEVGENVLTASRHRVVEVFGPPASLSRNGRCMFYRIVRSRHERWMFCFKASGEMDSAEVILPG